MTDSSLSSNHQAHILRFQVITSVYVDLILDMDLKKIVTIDMISMVAIIIMAFTVPAGVSSVEIWLPNTSTSC